MTNRFEQFSSGNRFTQFTASEAVSAAVDTVKEESVNALKSSGNRFLDTIAWFDAPRNALWQGSKELPFGEHGDPAGEFMKGLKRETFGSTQELIPDEFKEVNPVTTIVGGLAGDIATDPLTYTPTAVFTVPFKGIGKAAKLTGLINPLSRLADDSKLLRWLNVYTGSSKAAKEIADKYRNYKSAVRYRGIEDAKVFQKELESLANEMGVTVDALKADITRNIESGAEGITQGMRSIEQKLVQRNREMLELEIELGVEIGDLGPTYMAHILTPEGKGAIGAKEIKDYLSMRPGRNHASTEMRELEGTVAEINSKHIYGTDKLFYDDPVIIEGVRELRHAMVVGGKKYLDDVSELGVHVSEAPAGYVKVAGIEDVAFDPKVAEVIEQQFKIISSPAEMANVVKAYDGALRWWKMWSLGARPAYHFRNMLGNFWNAHLGGLNNPERYNDAMQLQYAMATGKLDGKFAGKSYKEIEDAMIDNGILNKGQYTADIETTIAKDLPGGKDAKSMLEKAWKYTGSTDNPVLQAGFHFGGGVENNARIALFLDRINKGDSYEDAAKHVKKYLFDYGDLSPMEQQVMKRVIPFYTWSRKNIPLQIEAIATQPDKIQKLNLVKQNIEQGADKPDQENVPAYIKEAGPIYVGNSPEHDVAKVVTLMNYLPLMDVGRIVEPEEFVNMVSPLMKAPLEYFVNYDSFRDKEIEEYKGQTTDFMGVRMPVHLAHLARNLIMLNEIDRANPANIFGVSKYDEKTGERTRTGSFGMDQEKTASIPGIGLRRGTTEGEAVQRGDMKFGIGTKREERTDLTGSARLIQYLFGVRVYNVDEQSGEIQNIKKFKRDISKLKGMLRQSAARDKTRATDELLDAIDKAAQAFDDEIASIPIAGSQ